MSTSLDRTVSKIAKVFLDFASFFAYPFLICIVLTDIVLRTVFNSPLPWGNEVSGFLLIICFFAPACTCEEDKSNIALDFLSCRFSQCGKWLVELLGCLSGGIWIGLLAYRNFTELPDMLHYGETGVEFHYPLWPLRLFLALALVLLFVRLCLNIVDLIGKIKEGA